jgi:predicted transcriptional regulator
VIDLIDKMKLLQRRERRNKMNIHYSILDAIMQESKSDMIVRPTRVQFLSGLSYDSMRRHLDDLKERKMIHYKSGISITEKGKAFVKDYKKIQEFTERLGLDYL